MPADGDSSRQLLGMYRLGGLFLNETEDIKRFPIMIGLLLGGFIAMFSETALNIALSSLAKQMDVQMGTIQWLVIGYLLVVGILLPLSGLLTRWFTTRQLLVFALSDFIVGAVIAALAPSFGMLLVGRMIQGIATGIILPLIYLVALSIYPMDKRGAAMGIIGLVIMFAPAIGPTLSGLILGALSWQYIFWVMVPLLAIALFLTVTYTKNVGEITRPHVDILSIVESTLGFGGIVIGVSLASETGWGSWQVILSLLVGVVSLALFCQRQLNIDEPILNVRAFGIRNFSVGTGLVMIDFMVIMSSMYLLPTYWQDGLMVPVALTGVLMLPGGIINALVSTVAGRLFDRMGGRRPVIAGFCLAAIGAILLVFTNSSSAYWYVVVAHVILMIGAPLAMSPSQAFGLGALPPQMAADGSSIMNTLQQVCGAIATALSTSLMSSGEAGKRTRDAISSGTRMGFMLTLALAIIGVIVATVFVRQQQAPSDKTMSDSEKAATN